MNRIRSTFIVTLAFGLLISACGALQPGTPAPSLPEESSTPTQPATTEAPAPTELPVETQTPEGQPPFTPTTYRDESAGIEFDYPADWSIDLSGQIGSRGSQVLFTSPGTTIETLAEGGSRLAAVTYLWDPKNDLDAYIVQRKLAWDASGFKILSEEQWTLTGDRKAVTFVITTPEEPTFSMITTIGEDYLVLSGNGNLNLLAEIAHTLRPIQ